MNIRAELQSYIRQLLLEHGHDQPVDDSESLILSGLLDSLAVVHIVVMMEQTFGIDFADIYFDQNVFDSIDSMVQFVKTHS